MTTNTPDVFLYNGSLDRIFDLEFIEFVSKEQQAQELLFLLVTRGGTPDAAYKIGRYLQSRYEHLKIYIPGLCKSAGTLLAIAGEELIFSPYGELGPLDVQMTKTDNIARLDSGLNISEAFGALEGRANATFHTLIKDIVEASSGIISFPTASHSASEILSSLYGPIFAKIDPEEVGSRARAMRIGEDYGKRLNNKFNNLKQDSLDTLSQTYSSHEFVIDMQEAQLLFERVREANEIEKALVDKHGYVCRLPQPQEIERKQGPFHQNLTEEYEKLVAKEARNGTAGKGDQCDAEEDPNKGGQQYGPTRSNS